tara:strand:- start:134 stop:796 length:663 start_codon:yes stop_codon:yes gene_type:complete
MKKYDDKYFEEIKSIRHKTKEYLHRQNEWYYTDEIEVEVGDWFVNYYKWQHPAHENIESSDIFTSHEFNEFEKQIPVNSIVLDIGAGAGYHTVAYSLFADKVIAFEPNYAAFEVLRENYKLNDKIVAYNIGCSFEDEKKTFWYRDETLYKKGNSDSSDVYLVNLNNFLKELHPEDIDKIKCIRIGFDDDKDVVLSTLSDIIEKNKPTIIKKGEESVYAKV